MTRVLYQHRSDPPPATAPASDAHAFHQALDGYRPTPLLALPELATELGVGHVSVKLETDRFGLPSFKIMGVSWAVVEALRPLPAGWSPGQGLRALAGHLPPVTLVAATDGNHGRALARVARLLGRPARIFVPSGMADVRVASIASEGAEVVRVPGTYDDAVTRSAREAEREGQVLVSDTSWPGYERIPAAVAEGYATILREVDEQLAAAGRPPPDLVLVPLGVGSFGAAVIRHGWSVHRGSPRVVGVEPTRAACVMASLAAGVRVTVPGPHDSVMAGLNCGTPSFIAWPWLREGLDGVVAVDDPAAVAGVRRLAAAGVEVGECSGAVVAAAQRLLTGDRAEAHRRILGIRPDSNLLLFATEGVTGLPTATTREET